MTIDLTTFLFELVNFVVLALVLQRFVYRPLRAGILARRDELVTVRANAQAQLEEAEARTAALRAREQELDALRQGIVAEAAEDAAKERARILAQARDDAAAERSRVEALLESEREAALGWVRDTAIERGVEAAGRLLLDLAPEAVEAALVDRLIETVGRRAEQLRADPEAEVEVTFASSPHDGVTGRLRAAVEDALGRAARMTVREDPSLEAGCVLRVGDRVLDASVAGQLEVLREHAHDLLADAEES